MVIQAFSTQLALPLLKKPYAHGHSTEIKVVCILAVVAHFTEVSEIVLAYCCFLFALAGVRWKWVGGFEVQGGRGGMAIGALGGW